jgi:hypothetical protein
MHDTSYCGAKIQPECIPTGLGRLVSRIARKLARELFSTTRRATLHLAAACAYTEIEKAGAPMRAAFGTRWFTRDTRCHDEAAAHLYALLQSTY